MQKSQTKLKIYILSLPNPFYILTVTFYFSTSFLPENSIASFYINIIIINDLYMADYTLITYQAIRAI